MQRWKAHYRDALHNTPIEIINTEEDYSTEPLSFTLDNITFCSSSLSGFHLKDEEQWEEASKKFSLLKWGGCAVSPYLYGMNSLFQGFFFFHSNTPSLICQNRTAL